MDTLEKQIASMSRRDQPLKDSLKSCLDAFREQRSQMNSLYDSLYTMSERLDKLEGVDESFRDEAAAVADTVEDGAELEEKQSVVEESAAVDTRDDSPGTSDPVQPGAVPEVTVDMPVEDEEDPFEQQLSLILEENSRYTEDRLMSIQKKDQFAKEQMRQVLDLAKKKRANNISTKQN